jgi:hypothetical protein
VEIYIKVLFFKEISMWAMLIKHSRLSMGMK